MAKRRKTRGGISSKFGLIIVLIAIIFFGTNEAEKKNLFTGNENVSSDAVYVHFIDVDQASATLIQSGDKGILIDAGEDNTGEALAEYINSSGVEKLEYVVASHPHSDHIGGMVDVFSEIPTAMVIMPELTEINTPTTRVYENFLNAILDYDIEVELSEVGEIYTLDGVTMTIFGPVKQVEDLNNMSVICKINANGTDIMVLGDAEKQELSSVYEAVHGEYKSDILVMGHHGSATSVYDNMLDDIDADIAIISCGKDNKYSHPHKEALSYIYENDMTLYRTDKDGTIVFKCKENSYERVD